MDRQTDIIFASLLEKRSSYSRIFSLLGSLILHGFVLAAYLLIPLLQNPSQLHEIECVPATYRMPELPEPPMPPYVRFRRKPMPLDWDLLRKRRHIQRIRKRKPPIIFKIIGSNPVPEDINLPEGDLNVFFDNDDVEVSDSGVPGGVEEVIGGSALLGKGKPAFEKMEPPGWGGAVPKLIKKVEPEYPKIAFRNRIEGVVRMVVLTDIYGKVSRIRVISGHPFLRTAAKKAVRQWVYEPVIVDGYPKPVLFVVVIRFQLTS